MAGPSLKIILLGKWIFLAPQKIAEQGTNHKQRVNQSKSQKTPTESQTSNNSSKPKQNTLETQNKPNFEKSILSAKKNISGSRLPQSSKSVFNKKHLLHLNLLQRGRII